MSDRRHKTNSWPLFILLIAGCFIAMTAWSIQKAVREVSPPLVRPATSDK